MKLLSKAQAFYVPSFYSAVLAGIVGLSAAALPFTANAQIAPTQNEIIDALSPPVAAPERTRSFRSRGLHNVDPSADLPAVGTDPAAVAKTEPPAKPRAIEATEITFKSNSDELTPEAQAQLQTKYASAIATVNTKYAEVRSRSIGSATTAGAQAGPQVIWVAGHTDDRGSFEYNDDLSTKRANATVNYLQASLRSKGDNITEVRLVPRGCGKHFLKVTKAGDVEANRRVVIKRAQDGTDACVD